MMVFLLTGGQLEEGWAEQLFPCHLGLVVSVHAIALIAHSETETNVRLVQAAPQGIEMSIASPAKSLRLLGLRDAALGRLDVVPTVDGIEYGTWEIARLAAEGVRVLNDVPTCSSRTTSCRPRRSWLRVACHIHARPISSERMPRCRSSPFRG